MGLGFEKFATGNVASSARNNDIDDFDFGNLGNSNKKKEESKQEDVFNFDVGGANSERLPAKSS